MIIATYRNRYFFTHYRYGLIIATSARTMLQGWEEQLVLPIYCNRIKYCRGICRKNIFIYNSLESYGPFVGNKYANGAVGFKKTKLINCSKYMQ